MSRESLRSPNLGTTRVRALNHHRAAAQHPQPLLVVRLLGDERESLHQPHRDRGASAAAGATMKMR